MVGRLPSHPHPGTGRAHTCHSGVGVRRPCDARRPRRLGKAASASEAWHSVRKRGAIDGCWPRRSAQSAARAIDRTRGRPSATRCALDRVIVLPEPKVRRRPVRHSRALAAACRVQSSFAGPLLSPQFPGTAVLCSSAPVQTRELRDSAQPARAPASLQFL